MATDFKEELRKAADEAAASEKSSVEHALRQAFYKGVEFEMARRRKELANALSKAKADNTPS
jgi:hypothetical protein